MPTHSDGFVREDPWRIFRIMAEFVESFETLSQLGRAVTIFGSARVKRGTPDYGAAVVLARRPAKNDFAVITAGRPGVMEAANKAESDGKGNTVGLNIELPHEQEGDRHSSIPINFHYFFARNVCFVKYSMGFVFIPGGFGPLDEIYEVRTSVQTHRNSQFPLILYGRKYWQGLMRWMTTTLAPADLICPGDLDLANITDSVPEALRIILEHLDRVGLPELVPGAFA